MSEEMKTPHPQIDKDGYVLLKNVRLSFPHLFIPRGYAGDETNPKFSTSVMIPNGATANLDALRIAINKAKEEKWPGVKKPVADDRICIKSGDDSDDERMHDHFILSTSSTRRPALFMRDKSQATDGDADLFYGGVWANVKVSPWAMDNKFGKRICCEIKAVLTLERGDQFGAKPATADGMDDDSDDSDQGDIPF